jgi:ceramide glucosyltransferase
MLWAAEPDWWPFLLFALLLRAAAGFCVAVSVLRDPLTRKQWWLVPFQDVLSFLFWIAGFFGNTIVWRGRKYYLYPDGRFAPSKS